MDSGSVPSAVALIPKPERIIKKIPGVIPPQPKESNVVLSDLSRKSLAELHELHERQKRILSNKAVVKNLADKGQKAAELKERIEQELKSRDEVDKAANLLSEMSLNKLNALEWTGRFNPGHLVNDKSHVDHPEGDESNPLKILATHSGTTAQRKQICLLKDEESLIKQEDLDESEKVKDLSGGASSLHVHEAKDENAEYKPSDISSIFNNPESYAKSICVRFGHKEVQERFKPNKPLKPFTGSFPIKPPGRVSSRPKQRVETNVTPPLPVHGDSKLLSLEESIVLQQEQNRKLKEIQLKHAADKLSSLQGICFPEQVPSSVLTSMAYRNPGEGHSDSENELNDADLEDQEVHDEDQKDHGTTVLYNIES